MTRSSRRTPGTSARTGSGPAASAAQAGWHQYPPDHPPSLDVVDPATWDPQARLQRMDDYGIWAQVLYPNVAGFGTGKVLAIGDPELMLACVQAYNDFLAEYASADPRRFVPIMALPMWDVELCRQEVMRATRLGHKGVIMTGEPAFWGLPKIADPHWDPLWALLQEAELSVNFHIGSGDMSIFDQAYAPAGPHANYAGFGVQFGMGNAKVIANLITGGVCHRFPESEVRLGGERHRLDSLRPGPPRLAVEELRRARRAPRVRPPAERVLRAPDVRLLLVRDGDGQVRHRAAGSGLDPLRERLPPSHQHVSGAGHGRRRPSEFIAGGLSELPEDVAAQDPPRQRRPPVSPRPGLSGRRRPTFSVSVYDLTATELIDIARTAEAAGFDGLWLGEHVLQPIGYGSIHPSHAASEPADSRYPTIVSPSTRLLDPLVALAAAAAVTNHIRLGTAIYLLPLRHPLLTARAVATLTGLAPGRFSLGVGAGWLEEEFQALEIPFRGRGARHEEALRVLRAALAGGPFDHDGDCFRFQTVQVSPDPVPVPLVLGGNSRAALRRAALLADGWFASGNPAFEDAAALVDQLDRYRVERRPA